MLLRVRFSYRLSTFDALFEPDVGQSNPGYEPEEVQIGNLLGPRYSKREHSEAKLFFTARDKNIFSVVLLYGGICARRAMAFLLARSRSRATLT
jgi:hypothetical protein